jgi:hypothetical protein
MKEECETYRGMSILQQVKDILVMAKTVIVTMEVESLFHARLQSLDAHIAL